MVKTVFLCTAQTQSLSYKMTVSTHIKTNLAASKLKKGEKRNHFQPAKLSCLGINLFNVFRKPPQNRLLISN